MVASHAVRNAPGRQIMHTRQVSCMGYRRDDGLFDIEGRMQDLTPVASDLLFKRLEPGDRIHDMGIVMTIDADLVIHDLRAQTRAGPAPQCLDVAAFYAALKGLRIGRGFRRKVQELVGGVKGCTHLTELLGPMGTTAMQTLFAVRRAERVVHLALQGTEPMPRPQVVGTCHTYREGSEATEVIWPTHRRA